MYCLHKLILALLDITFFFFCFYFASITSVTICQSPCAAVSICYWNITQLTVYYQTCLLGSRSGGGVRILQLVTSRYLCCREKVRRLSLNSPNDFGEMVYSIHSHFAG